MAIKTIDTSGTGDYTSWQAWEDSLPAILLEAEVGQGVNEEISSINTVLTIGGHTTTSANTITVTARVGDSFVDNVSVETNSLRYVATVGTSILCTGSYKKAIEVLDDNVTVSRLQVKTSHVTSFALTANFPISPTLNQCIFESANLVLGLGGVTSACRNSLVIRTTGGGANIVSLKGALTGCTIVVPSNLPPATYAFKSTYGAVSITNCAIFGVLEMNDPGLAHGSAYTFTNCMTDVPLPPSGCTTIPYGVQFENSLNDWRIKIGAGLIDAGVDDVNGTPSINGVARASGLYDVGAWEFASGGGPPLTFKPYFSRNVNQLIG